MEDAAMPDSIENESSSTIVDSAPQSESLLTQAEFVEYIKEYPFAAEPTYFTRANRYYGPASTWRSWTAKDRAVSDALEITRARDLSIHLYNAFAMKRRAGRRPDARKARSRSRSRARTADPDDVADAPFVPPETWTAWPLRGAQMPHEDRGYDADRPSSKPGKTTKPSTALQETLIATTMKQAKEKWEARQWTASEEPVKGEKRDWRAEKDLTKKQMIRLGLLEDVEADSKETPEETESEEGSSSDHEVPEGIQTFSSQAFAVDSSSSTNEDPAKTDSEDERPVFSADDDHARRILMPSTRHILSKLDDLLTGLHKAREAYSVRPAPRSRSLSRVSGAETTDDERISRPRNQDRKRRRSTSSERSADVDGRSLSRPRSRRAPSTVREYGTKGQGLGLRDWSDVIGMAALTGWNTATVARASERCAKLFEQNMMFRTLYEAPAASTGQDIEEPAIEESYAYVSDGGDDDLSAGDTVREDEKGKASGKPSSTSREPATLPVRGRLFDNSTLSCPIQTCPQSKHTYSRPTRLYEHIRTMHPEFDLPGYKRIASRTSRRGRYDRSKLRSRTRHEEEQEDGSRVEEDEPESTEAGRGDDTVHYLSDSTT